MVTAAYERAGLTTAEVQHVTNLVAAVEAADPAASWVAVARKDVLAVVGVLDRFVDRSLPLDLMTASGVRLVIVSVIGQHPSSRIVIPDLETMIRVLRRSGRWPGA